MSFLIDQMYLGRQLTIMTLVISSHDFYQFFVFFIQLFWRFNSDMIVSKTFGYAVRAILLLAIEQEKSPTMQSEEIAQRLKAPKHFMAKILKRLAQEGLIQSNKGPNGGFALLKDTLKCRLLDLVHITDVNEPFDFCVLRWDECNSKKPCPMHFKVAAAKKEVHTLFHDTTIGDLLIGSPKDLLEGLLP